VGKRGFVAPVNTVRYATSDTRGSNNADAHGQNSGAPEGEKKMNNAIYKKPAAFLMMIFAILAGAFYFLYYNVLSLGYISEKFALKIVEKLPTFGGEKFSIYVNLIFGGLIFLLAIFGLTGKRGKAGFFFVLLADLAFIAIHLFTGSELVEPMIKVDAIAKIIDKYNTYITYGIYGLLALGAIAFIVSISGGREELEISGGTAVLPILYMLIAVLGYAALVILPKFMSSFTVKPNYIRYTILAIWGIALLLTLIGVHSATASRGANAWLLFATAMIVALIFAAEAVLEKFGIKKQINPLPEILYAISPVIVFFPLAGFAAADLRN